MPGRIIGGVMRRNAVHESAPSELRARARRCDQAPLTEASTSRMTNGVMMIMCATISHANEPVAPIIAKKRSNAMPSTRPGITSGESSKPFRKARPGSARDRSRARRAARRSARERRR